VKKVGFAGHVDPHPGWDDELGGHDDEHEWDEDLWDETTPEDTPEEEAHHEEHGEYPDSHYERHDLAYAHAVDAKRREDMPDHEDEGLGNFISDHASEAHTWQNKGKLGKVDLTKPVYAVQSHVHTGHLDRYQQDPKDTGWHEQKYGDTHGYLASQHPHFATHQGRLHVVDGTHRVANALLGGKKSIQGWHINLDEHPHLAEPEEY
jgi:hypothetical protein